MNFLGNTWNILKVTGANHDTNAIEMTVNDLGPEV